MDWEEDMNPFYLEASTNIIRYYNFLEPEQEPIVEDEYKKARNCCSCRKIKETKRGLP